MRQLARCLFLLCWTAVLSSCSRQHDEGVDKAVPEIGRVGSSAVVFGCDGELDWNAKGACPWVRCQAAILNSGGVDLVDEIKLQGGPVSEDGSKQLIVGTATSPRPDAPARRFVHCLIERRG
jgi:hypothetical protein